MTELNQNQIIKWTGLITEHPEAIVSLGNDATYPLIRLAVEHEAPQYALDSVKQELLENVYHDIDIENANHILYKTDHYSEPVHGIISLDKDREDGESVKFDSNRIFNSSSFMEYDKYDVTLRDLPSAYSRGRIKYEDYDVRALRNILLQGRINLTDINLHETEQYVYVADVLNELSKLGYYELVERLLEDLYEHDMTAYIKLSDVFYGWAATDYFIQKELQRKRPEYAPAPYAWTNGYDIKLNREDLIRVKKEKADKEVIDAKPLFSDKLLSDKDKKILIEDNLDENSAEKMLNQAMFALVTGVILFGIVIFGFMLLNYLF